MGLGEVVESALQAHDGDGDVGQAGEVARQVSGVHPAPVLVVGDVTHVVDSVLYAPVPSDQGKDSFGAGVLEGQRGQSMDGLMVHDAGLSVPSLALDAERDPAMGELGLAGVGIGAQVDDPARAFLQPPVSFVLGAMLGGAHLGSLPVQAREVGEQREPIGLHRRHDVVRLAIVHQMPCGVVLGMQGIDGDDPSGQGEPGGQRANGGDLVALVGDGADAVYTLRSLRMVSMLAEMNMPVMGHLGLVPRHSTWTGGLRAVGKTAEEALELYRDFKRLEDAGAFAVEVEVVPEEVLAEITNRTSLVTFSIGAGSAGDVQFLFFHMEDVCGDSQTPPRHAKAYADLRALRRKISAERIRALKAFRRDVESGGYPGRGHTVRMDPVEFDKFREGMAKHA